jgi:hypothetical protein
MTIALAVTIAAVGCAAGMLLQAQRIDTGTRSFVTEELEFRMRQFEADQQAQRRKELQELAATGETREVQQLAASINGVLEKILFEQNRLRADVQTLAINAESEIRLTRDELAATAAALARLQQLTFTGL